MRQSARPRKKRATIGVHDALVGVSLHTAQGGGRRAIGSGDVAKLAYRGRLELLTDLMPAQAYHVDAGSGLS